MANDNTFRLMLLVLIAAVAPWAAYHRMRAHTGEKLDRWQEGPFILFGLRLGGLPMFIAGLAWFIHPPSMAWSSLPLPAWARWLGLALACCTGLLLVWTFRNLGRNLTDTVVTRKDHVLITSGPYRYVRHPFYLAFALGTLGGSLAMANWFVLLGAAIPMGFLLARTPVEEQKLLERFGVEYQSYSRRVGRFVPRWPSGGV